MTDPIHSLAIRLTPNPLSSVDEVVDLIRTALAPAWRSLDEAPRDGTMIWLLVDYDGEEGEHPLADATIGATIGFNNLEHDGEDKWHFAGWCWTHDHFTEGQGKVVGWMPISFPLAQDPY